ncbi:MAG: MATE family efflux transporter [Rhodobacteraceae bacterium]|jgi:MATE family multidrug resistance protein|nr:MATE family efflux transporter [Paracoccaceae bacterium]
MSVADTGIAEITHRRIWRIAGPIVLSNATVPLLGAVDTGVVGQMGAAAPIGAVGLGAIILTTVYWIFGFLRMGTSGLAAQAQGAGDMAERSAILLRALVVAGVAGLALILLQLPLVAAAFAIAPAGPEVEALARDYVAIRIWGAPATIALYAITGWLLAVERAQGMMAVQLWINAVNVILDLWFVLGLGWGVGGVAAATLIAEWTGVVLGLWLCREAFGPVLRAALARLWDAAALRVMAVVNRDIMIRSVVLQLSFTTFIFLGAREGDVTLAANQVLMQFLGITAYALDGFAFAAETLVGQAVGLRRPAMVRQATRLALIWGFAGAGALGLVFALAGGPLIDLMTTAPDVRAEARTFLPWVAVSPLLGTAAWTWDGVYIGATLTRLMRNLMLASVAIYAVALAVLVPAFGNHGLWAALSVLNIARSILMTRHARAAVEKAT